ncbi:MAG: CehA/McbA family metallohydrolase [Planctomycetota bacterium]
MQRSALAPATLVAPHSLGLRLLIAAALLLAGCRSLTWQHRPAAGPDDTELIDLRGSLHVHTGLSHDSDGTLEELAAIAEGIGLDFVLVTDHNDRHEGPPARQFGDVLVLLGTEYGTDRGHLVTAFDPYLRIHRHDSSALARSVRADGGLAIVAHPYWRSDAWRWAGHEDEVTHIELANLAVDFAENPWSMVFSIPQFLFTPARTLAGHLERPDAEIRLWDELLKERKVVAVGAADAHQRWYAGYDELLPLLTTHVLAKEKSAIAIRDALRVGRCYIAWDVFGTTDAFRFRMRRGEETFEMGSEIMQDEGASSILEISVPAGGTLTVLRDGAPWFTSEAHRLQMPIDRRGVYRAEVLRDGSPWIISNPIIIR